MVRYPFIVFLAAVVFGTVMFMFTACTSQEEQLRKTRFGFRELHLPMELKNAELRLDNDKLEKRRNPTKIAVDTYLLQQSRAAVQVMNRFEEVWSYTIDRETMKGTFGTGDRDLMLKLSEVEKRFDDANRECAAKHADSAPYEFIVPKTVSEVEARCASFRETLTAVMEQPTATESSAPTSPRIFASAPVESGGCASEIDEVPYSANVESPAHTQARQKKDNAQQRCDNILSAMKQESAKCKNLAATTNETDADQTERVACVKEEKRLSAIGDTRYEELNAAVRRLNAVTESERN
ncbi:MAG: hypothetical protein ABSG03_01250 [Bryobacteraceae bacterium]|jgi:hypothetical protein